MVSITIEIDKLVTWKRRRGQSKYTEARGDREKNRKVVGSGETAGKRRERREREKERRERDARYGTPLSYKKNAVFFLGDIFLISPCIWNLYNALNSFPIMYCLGKSTSLK